jgi:hypothetical protein
VESLAGAAGVDAATSIEADAVCRLPTTLAPARRRSTCSATSDADWDGLLNTLLAHAHGLAATVNGIERLLTRLLLAPGLPKVVIQFEVVEDGNRYVIDLAYPEPSLNGATCCGGMSASGPTAQIHAIGSRSALE